MKNIYKIAFFLVLLFSVNKSNAQLGCLTPSLGVYNGSTFAPLTASIACTYTDIINISPTQFYNQLANTGTSPCIRIKIGLTNANAASNNSIAIGQGVNNPIYNMCPVACNTIIPNSSSYTMSLFFVDPAQNHGYTLCNTNIAPNMNYTVCSCYNNTPLASGVWNNGLAGGCQTVNIPAGSAIGLATYSINPAVVSTASLDSGTGDFWLDPNQMAQGIYTVTYCFNSQGVGGNCGCVTRTISITNPYSANWTALGALCANGACVNLNPQITGNTGGNFSGTAVSSNSFCPTIAGAGTFPITYTVGISPQCGRSFSNNIVVNPVPTANAGPTQSLTCANITTVMAGSGGGTYSWSGPGIISGGTTANPVVGTAGTYSLTVTSGGCTSPVSTAVVGVNNVAPSTTVSTTGSVTCTNSVISLGSLPAGMNYTWTAPAGSSITGGVNSQSTTASGPGTYTVRVLDPSNGCFTTTTIAANINQGAPTGLNALTSGSVTCNNLSINLSTTLTGVTYTWTAPAGSSITGGANVASTTGSGPGTYTIRVTSAVNGCTTQATVAAFINQTVTPTTASTSGSITCTNSTSISFTATPTSGVTYTWTAPVGSSITGGVNSQITTGSGPGTYTVRVTDAVNGCTNIATVAAVINTTAPTGVSATSSVAITCATNTVNLNGLPAGGNYTWTAPGTGAITGGANNQNTTGQGPGTYTLVYQSAVNGCTASAVVAASVNTTVPTGVGATTAGTVTCSSLAINLTATVTGGPYTYSWTAPAGSSITSGATSSSATGSGGGTYSVVVTGTNGCSAAVATILANSNTVAPVPTINTPSVLTCATTSVVLTSTTTGVLYSWSGPGIVTATNQSTVGVVLVGTYSLVVQNSVNSCTAVTSVVVSNNTIAPTALGSGSVNITCATPSVSLIGSANPSSCTVVWTGGVCAGATSYTATACSPGTYFMTVTNPANGCSSSPASFTVASNSNFPVATLANTATITCINTTAQVVATTTASPVTYTWSGPGVVSGATTPTITVNMGGVYTLTLTNTLNGCVSVITNSVTNDNAAVTPSATASNTITCSTTTVVMTATVAAAGTYSYTWSGPGIVGTNTLSTATSSLGGTYNVTVTNTTNGCVGVVGLTVSSSTTAPTGVAITPSTFTLSCANPTTALTATAVGASTYSWIAPATGAIISGGTSATAGINGPGNYSVVVTGTNGCSAAVAEATISPNNLAPTFTLSNTSPSITCLSSNPTVSVGITSTVGIGTYSWSPASGISGSATGSVVTFTTAGTFTGVITATNGCQSNAIVTVVSATTAPMFVVGTATASNLSCANPNVIINPAYTPTTDITFSWSGPGIVGSTTNSSVTVNQNGQYSVTVTNTVTGCSSTSLTIDVFGTTTPPTLNITSSSSVGIGCSATNSTNILNANALPTAVNYTWSNSANTPTILVTTSGIYSVTIVDPVTSCSATAQYTVLNNSVLPNATAGANVVMPCGGSTTTVTLNGNSTTAGVTYTWTGPGVVSGANTATAIANMPGTYTLAVSDPTTGCTATSTVLVINGVPTASFTTDVTTGFAPQAVVFTNASTGAITYNWIFGDGSTSTATNTSNTYTASGTYTAMLIASSGVCSDTAYTIIVIQDGFSLDIPNVFTPNNDGTNDFFTIKSTGVKEISLQIFNRWGQLMYEFTGAKAAWDGVTNNGQKATDGTYFYFIIATGFDTTKEPVKKNGPVTLFR